MLTDAPVGLLVEQAEPGGILGKGRQQGECLVVRVAPVKVEVRFGAARADDEEGAVKPNATVEIEIGFDLSGNAEPVENGLEAGEVAFVSRRKPLDVALPDRCL
jgi:hypothetical protein